MINNIEDIKQGILINGLREHIAKCAEHIVYYVRGSDTQPHLKTYYEKKLKDRVEEKIVEIREALRALAEYDDE